MELFKSLVALDGRLLFTAFNFCLSAAILSMFGWRIALGSLLLALSEFVDCHDCPFLNFSSCVRMFLANYSDSFLRFLVKS